MWSLRNIYLYLICFVTLMMMVFGATGIVRDVADIIFPTDYSFYNAPKFEDERLSQEQIDKITQENRQKEQRNQQMENKKRLIKSISFVLIALPVFVYHWRKIENPNKKDLPTA